MESLSMSAALLPVLSRVTCVARLVCSPSRLQAFAGKLVGPSGAVLAAKSAGFPIDVVHCVMSSGRSCDGTLGLYVSVPLS